MGKVEKPGRWKRISSSLSAKLTVMLVASMAAVFLVVGYMNLRVHKRHLEAATLLSAERTSDIIKRSASYCMLRNDREGLYHIITTMANEPGVVGIRIFNREGRISFSTDGTEVNTYVDKRAEACYACHARAEPLTRLNRPDRFRIYRRSGGRVLGVINAIENQPSCSAAACHAHPPDQKILGVLDTNLSLARADADLAAGSRQMLIRTLLAVVLISVLSGLFVWRFLNEPLRVLKAGTERLARGDLGHQIPVRTKDEVGDLANSFNWMSRELYDAREEITLAARTLEARVEQKTCELKRAHDHMLQVEKMASVGKLAATVAHEINNPLSGILTYAKLLKKWLERGNWDEPRREQVRSSLDLIESESRRCGEIVRNLLMFARAAPMNLDWVCLNDVVHRCVRLVRHKLDVTNIQLREDLVDALPAVRCDASQIEQALLSLIMNAIDAMPGGGNLWLSSRLVTGEDRVRLSVKDDGVGIPADVLSHLFEPFFTTKEAGRGVGLGLAVARSILERHKGSIEVQSDPGHGTTFTLVLPLGGDAALSKGDSLSLTA